MLPPSPAPCISLKDLEQISLLATGMMLSAQRMLDCSSGSHLPGQECMVEIMLGRHRAGMQWNRQTLNRLRTLRRGRDAEKALIRPKAMGEAGHAQGADALCPYLWDRHFQLQHH